jgi:diguanylate cyclase (GGDEF)-like protein
MDKLEKTIIVGVVDDDDIFRDYLKGALEHEGCKVLDAADGESFVQLVGQREIDCILLDYSLVNETGFHVYERVRNARTSMPPVVMLSANDQQSVAIKAFRSGVTDFISKRDLRVDKLKAAIEKAVREDHEEHQRAEQLTLLKSQHPIDLATGLFARHEVDKRIGQMAASAARSGGSFAMILGFIAGMQGISDRFGHVQGDKAMRTAASRFREAMRACDQGGRVNDAVFVCLVDSDPSPATVAAIEAAIVKALTFDFRIQAASISLTAQTASVRFPQDGADPSALLGSALATFVTALAGPAAPTDVFCRCRRNGRRAASGTLRQRRRSRRHRTPRRAASASLQGCRHRYRRVVDDRLHGSRHVREGRPPPGAG